MDFLADLPQLTWLISTGRFIIMLSVLVFVHELGHFAVAKWCGIYVATFSIGFGRRLFGFKWGDTDYRVSAIPLGGYVKMIGQSDLPDSPDTEPDPDELACPDDMRFDAKPVWKRIAVSAAGPGMSLGFGVVVYWVMFVSGVPMPRGLTETRVGYVREDGPAAAAGIQPGDRILSVGGVRTKDWESLKFEIIGAGQAPVDMTVEHPDGTIRTVTIQPHIVEGESFASVGIGHYEEYIVEDLFPDQAAARAGVQEADVIVGLRDPAGVEHPVAALQDVVRENIGKPILFHLRRGEAALDVPVTPDRSVTIAGIETDGVTVLGAGGPSWADTPRRQIPRAGDIVSAINGIPIPADDPMQMVAALGDAADVAVPVQFRRGSHTWSVRLKTSERGLIGIRYSLDSIVVRYAPLAAVPKAFEKFMDTLRQTLMTFTYLLKGSVSAKEMAGPLGIWHISDQAAKVGWQYYLYLVGVITVNLGIINILPIPVLDGGNIAVLLFEGVRRRPLSERSMYYMQQVGLVVLLFMIVFVTFNDIRRIIESIFSAGLG